MLLEHQFEKMQAPAETLTSKRTTLQQKPEPEPMVAPGPAEDDTIGNNVQQETVEGVEQTPFRHAKPFLKEELQRTIEASEDHR